MRTGGRAGEVRRFTEPTVVVGRAEGVGLRLDPDSDLEVSARHARFDRTPQGWWVRDLGSRNGTWVDGERVDEARIGPGTRVRFGGGGPEVEVLAGAGTPGAALGTGGSRAGLVWSVSAVVVVGLAALTLASVRGRASDARAWEAERQALLARADSILAANRDADAAVARLRGEVDGLDEALQASRQRVEALQEELARLADGDEPDPAQLADLRSRIDAASAVVSGQELAAGLDAPGLIARVRPAVVMVYAEFVSGRRSVATGFAVTGDGRVVTNRHVVTGPDGRDRIARLGVQFSGSPQLWPASVVRTGEGDVDLALLELRNLVGGNPAVDEINDRPDTLRAGTPVLILGFPNAAPAASPEDLPRALATAGGVLGLRSGRLEIDGWGAEGASGSPVVDGTGRIAGVVFGAAGGADDRHLVTIPGDRLRAFLDGN